MLSLDLSEATNVSLVCPREKGVVEWCMHTTLALVSPFMNREAIELQILDWIVHTSP